MTTAKPEPARPALTPSHYVVGATYRHPLSGFVGVAQPPDNVARGRRFKLADGTEVASIGPHLTDPDRWAVANVDDPDGVPFYIGRHLTPTNYPRVGLQTEAGPKGAPERRYFPAAELELIDPTHHVED